MLTEFDFSDFAKDKYKIAKYAIKMATGTGKTWVMHAIMIWQILNALAEDGEEKSGRFTKNFLLVAPGLIVYERLLDAYKGKETSVGRRDFATSDLMKFQELFIPQAYRDKIFAFVQNNVVEKDDIGRKITGNGLIAITNWHLFIDYSDEAIDETASALNAPDAIVNALLPAKPGISSGNALDALDRKYLQGSEIEYLADLEDLMVINDEAHHIHELKKGGEVKGSYKDILHISLPLAGAGYVSTALHTAENLLVPTRLSLFYGMRERGLELYGAIRGMAMPVLFFPASFPPAVCSPAFVSFPAPDVPPESVAVCIPQPASNIAAAIRPPVSFRNFGFKNCVRM